MMARLLLQTRHARTARTSSRETSFNYANISFDAMGGYAKEEVLADSMELENSLPANDDDENTHIYI